MGCSVVGYLKIKQANWARECLTIPEMYMNRRDDMTLSATISRVCTYEPSSSTFILSAQRLQFQPMTLSGLAGTLESRPAHHVAKYVDGYVDRTCPTCVLSGTRPENVQDTNTCCILRNA